MKNVDVKELMLFAWIHGMPDWESSLQMYPIFCLNLTNLKEGRRLSMALVSLLKCLHWNVYIYVAYDL